MIKECPDCKAAASALNANPHCRSKTCTWNKCKCGATYDRNTGSSFNV